LLIEISSLLKSNNFNVIGIGVTFSPNLKANICESSRLALIFEAKLVLIHIGESSREKVSKFQGLLEPFISDGLDYEIVFRQGDPVETIIAVSEELGVDLLILGALKKENILKYYIGSIARKITRQANCSILLLINPSEERVPCQHIVVNGLEDPKTKQTITTAFRVASKLGANKVTIVEEINQQEVAVAIEDDESLRRANIRKERLMTREDARVQKMLTDIPEFDEEKISINLQPIFGKSGYSIGHYAQISRADLLIMNAPDKVTFWDRLFPHDIEHILTELPTDVLIVR
jgi:nucleotide-binding universal stress UspA family protein